MLNYLLRSKWKTLLYFICLFVLLLSYIVPPMTIQAKQKEKITYIALGDSLTAGKGSSEVGYLRLQSFVPKLTSHLRKEYEVHVENHGIPGITSTQFVWYLQQGLGIGSKLQEADLMTITIGGNDLLQLLGQKDITPEKIEQTINQFGQQLEEAITVIRSHNAEVAIYMMDLYTPYDQEHPLHELSKLAISSYNKKLEELLKADDNIHLVSIYNSFLNQGSTLTHVTKEDFHPNDLGYKVIFDAFRKSLSKD